MHKIQEKEFTLEDFSHEHLINMFEEPIPYSSNECYCCNGIWALEQTIDLLNGFRDNYLKTKDKKYWWNMIQLLPSSYNQTRNVMMNYEVLCNIYKSRKNHKLDEWRDFCKFIEELPYSELICGEVDIMTPNEQREKLEEVADKFCEIGNINPLSKEEIEQSVNLFRIKEN